MLFCRAWRSTRCQAYSTAAAAATAAATMTCVFMQSDSVVCVQSIKSLVEEIDARLDRMAAATSSSMSKEAAVVHVIRHGQVWNPDAVFYGRSNTNVVHETMGFVVFFLFAAAPGDIQLINVSAGRLPNFRLHPDGRKQATAAGEFLSHRPGSNMVSMHSSPLLRARETAGLIAAALGQPGGNGAAHASLHTAAIIVHMAFPLTK